MKYKLFSLNRFSKAFIHIVSFCKKIVHKKSKRLPKYKNQEAAIQQKELPKMNNAEPISESTSAAVSEMEELKEIKEMPKKKPESPKPAPILLPYPEYSTESFLARVNMNEKIQNILRSPIRGPNGVRQRSVFTAASSSAPAQDASATLAGGRKTPKETSSSARKPTPVQMHLDAAAPHFACNSVLEPPLTTMTSRSAVVPRNGFSGRRYAVAPSTPIYGYDADMVRLGSPSISPALHCQQFPTPMPPPPFAMNRLSGHRRSHVEYENNTPPTFSSAGPIAMTNGTIQLRLREGIRIDITLDKAVRILNERSMVAIALSRNCNHSAMIHPNGRILQSGSKVEIVTYDGMKTNSFVRYAKMWYKGVSFTSESCALVYLVDTAGTRTTADTFTDMTKDYTLTVFYSDSRHGPSFVQDAAAAVEEATYTCGDDGTETYDINGFRITQGSDGLVKLCRNNNKCLIRTSPSNGSATLTTPGIHCTASLGKTSHLFVRRNEKRMHFDGSCFIVRNAGHSAGFNENNLLIVY